MTDEQPKAVIDIEYAERAERAARAALGLPQHHVLDLAEFPFAFAKDELRLVDGASKALIAAEPTNKRALIAHACVQLAQRDYEGANATMDEVRRLTVNPVGLTRMQFGRPPRPSSLVLPPVQGEYPKGPSYFVSCDLTYFHSYGLPLLRSIAALNRDTPVHFHFMNDSQAQLRLDVPMRITVSVENPVSFLQASGLRPADYFGAVRLVRFAEALSQSSGPLVMLDADCLANRDPMKILERSGDVGLRVRPGRSEPWHQFSACMVMGRPGAHAYFNRVADIIRGDLDLAWWGMDQYALFSAWVGLRPDVTLFGPEDADVNETDQGTFLFTAGSSKKTLLTDETPYARLYRKYRG